MFDFRLKEFHTVAKRLNFTKAADKLFAVYQKIETGMAAINQKIKETIRVGPSTTVAQYILPGYLASFRKRFRDISVELITNNTEHIEHFHTDNKIDFDAIEGQSSRKQRKNSKFLKDELVLCTRYVNPLNKKGSISVRLSVPFILRIMEQKSRYLTLSARSLLPCYSTPIFHLITRQVHILSTSQNPGYQYYCS